MALCTHGGPRPKRPFTMSRFRSLTLSLAPTHSEDPTLRWSARVWNACSARLRLTVLIASVPWFLGYQCPGPTSNQPPQQSSLAVTQIGTTLLAGTASPCVDDGLPSPPVCDQHVLVRPADGTPGTLIGF